MSEMSQEQTPNKWMALLVLAVAVVLLVGGVGLSLKMSSSGSPGSEKSSMTLGDPVRGRQVVLKLGCVQCHTDDGTRAQGPSFRGLFGSTVTYIDGSTGVVDDADVRYAMREPAGKVIDGFDPQMPKFEDRMTEDDKLNLVAYLKSIGAK